MEKKSDYSKKLLDPRWQKKRLEILQRDSWTCQHCLSTTDTLHVHHRRYIQGKDPWDYDDSLLVALCESCHSIESEQMPEVIHDLACMLKDKFFAVDVYLLADALNQFDYFKGSSNDAAFIIAFMLKNEEVFNAVRDVYQEYLKNSKPFFEK